MICEICLKEEGKKRSKYSGLILCEKCLKEDQEYIKKSQEASKGLFD